MSEILEVAEVKTAKYVATSAEHGITILVHEISRYAGSLIDDENIAWRLLYKKYQTDGGVPVNRLSGDEFILLTDGTKFQLDEADELAELA